MEIAKRIVSINKRLIISLLAFSAVFSLIIGGVHTAGADQPYEVTGEQVDVSGINYRGTILEDVKMFNGTDHQNCHWVSGGYNSGRSASGQLMWFHDPVQAKICRNSNSPTGWVKVDGGQTGRNCGNPYKPQGPPPGQVVNGPVMMVRNFNNINMNATARAQVNLKENIVCPDGSTLDASSTGSAVAQFRINQQMLMSAQGNVDNLKAQLKSSAKAKAIAKAQGNIQATCGSAPQPKEKQTEVLAASENPAPPPPPSTPPPSETPAQQTPPTQPEQTAPETVPAAAPQALPNTGPGAVITGFIGVSSIASLVYYVVARRLGA